MSEDLIQEQIDYYRARASEYDEWFLRVGRYDRGEANRRAWFGEVGVVEADLRQARPRGRALELACGTGLWTRQLVEMAAHVTAVDASPECLELNKKRIASDRVHYVCADIFGWQPPELFDFVFFGFWLSHVPPERFDSFWAMVRAALRPGGSVYFVDTARNDGTGATNHRLPDEGSIVMERVLNDGRRFQVVKVFYEPLALEERLRAGGWRGYVRASGELFIHGCLQPNITAAQQDRADALDVPS